MDKSRLSLPVGELASASSTTGGTGTGSNGSSGLANSGSNSGGGGGVLGTVGGSGSASSSGADTSSFTSLYCGTTTGCQSDRCGVVANGVVTPCTPGDPMTHYHHRNTDHYNAAFACMNRMRIHAQVRLLAAVQCVIIY